MINKKEKLREIYEKISTPDEKIIDLLEKIDKEKLKGEDGYTPKKGEDYFTDDEIKEFLDAVTPKKGKHYFDGKKPTEKELIEIIVPLIPEPKHGNVITAEEVRDKIKSLKGKEKLSVFDLKDTEWLKGKDKMNWSSAGFKVYTDTTLTGDGSFANPLHAVNTGSGGSGFQLPLTGAVNGSNQTYTWLTAPNAICVDGNVYYKVTQDAGATVIWTGTTTTAFTSLTPNSLCFAVA